MKATLVETEEDLQYINVASSKNTSEHGLIRLILSSMADIEEVSNLTPNDIVEKRTKKGGIFYVYLRKGRSVRKAPIDRKTYTILREISRSIPKKSKIFNYTQENINEIIARYSPKGRRYSHRYLIRSVRTIISDNLLGRDIDDIKSAEIEELWRFMNDFHPIFSGMWDLDEDDVAFDYFQMLSERHGISSYSEMAEISGEKEERIEKLMKRGWFRNCMDS